MAVWDSGFAQLRGLWSGFSMVQRAVLVVVTAGFILGLGSLMFWAGTPEYGVLFARLSTGDASQVAEKLREQGVPYRLSDGGGTVMVPIDQVYDLRLTMAGEGFPQGGVVGFEIFDRSGFGMTDFAQKVNYSRALEGELTRTIRSLNGVQGARVHLVLPERRLFETESRPASASVVLQLAAGRALGPKQIQGVVALVASSVEGLAPEGVTVIDTRGAVLYKSGGDEPALMASNQLEYKRAYERDVERRVREMLETVLGAGKAVVQVAAEFDFSRVEETSETYDPEAVAVRSEERSSETSKGASAGPSGVPGVASNVAGANLTTGAPGGGGAPPASSTKEVETVNYEVSKKVTHVQKSPGTVVRLSVAVAVDGTYQEPEDGGPKMFVPRTAEELGQIRALVERAVGLDAQRGDGVEVTSIPFQTAEVPEVQAGFWGPHLILPLARYGTAILLTLLVLLFVARPLFKTLSRPSVVAEMTGPVSVAEMEARLAAGGEAGGGAAEGTGGTGGAAEAVDIDETPPTETLRREELKRRLTDMVQTEPEVAAHLVRSWMSGD